MHGQNEWPVLHHAAMQNPVNPEIELVDLLRIITRLTERFGRDHVLREGVADLIEGANALLNADWGPRLITDECRVILQRAAHRIGYNIDTERFTNSRAVDTDFRVGQR